MYFNVFFIFFLSLCLMLFMCLVFTFLDEKVYILEMNLLYFDMFYDYKMYFYIDYISNIFMLVISLICMSSFFYMKFYMFEDKMKNKFIFFTFLFVMSMYMLILSMNFIMLLIAWDLLGVSSYFLVIHYMSDNSNYSGLVTLLTNRLGDIGMIISIFFMSSNMSFDIMCLIFNNNLLMVKSFFMFCCLAGFTKSAQFPFSSWLPLAMAAPTPISALVHSSTLVTAGVYLFIRLNYMFKINSLFVSFLLILSGFTMLISSLGALSEMDIKKIIAYSTLSQLSLMMMIVILGLDVLSFFHILTHALFKALLFLCSGIMIHSCYEIQDIRIYNYFLKSDKFILCIFFICSMSLAGFPFMSGFYSKDMILELIYSYNYNLFYVLMLMLNTIGTSLYSIRVIYYGFLMGVKNSKVIFLVKWDNINNSLLMTFWGVLFSGVLLYWMMMEKLSLIFLNLSLKFINLFMIMLSILICLKLKYSFIYSKNNFVISMMYLYKTQGQLMNNLYKNCLFFTYYSEHFFEYLFYFKIYNNLLNFSKLMFINKFMNMYYSFIFVLMIFMIMF